MKRSFLCVTIAAALVLAACAPRNPAPATSPAPLATGLPTPLALPSSAPPQILAVQLSDPVFHSDETVTGTIVTSTNVSSVLVQFAGRAAHIPQSAPGLFALSYKLPHIPFFMDGTYTAQVIARNALGLSVQRAITVSVR